MNQDIYFMPLGGGQRVGASCYYLKLGNANIILDAGTGIKNGTVFEPGLYSLLTSPFIQSLNQIDQIFISHAHADHVGYLPRLWKDASHASVYMTDMTAMLSEYQLYDRNYVLSGIHSVLRGEEERLAVQFLLGKVARVSYMNPLNFANYKVTFFPAGHIPGAMMMLFEYGRRRILYTGDFSLSKTALTEGCILPEKLAVDTVIMCGLHAKHPNYKKRGDSLYKTINYIYSVVKKKKIPVRCCVQQLSKGIEFLKTLNERNSDEIPIYVDESVMPIVRKLEQLSIPILDVHNHVRKADILKPHIFVTSKSEPDRRGIYEEVRVDFSLHEDFNELIKFIKWIDPKQAVVVHCAPKYEEEEDTIEQRIMLDGECRTQFLFPEEEEIYRL